MTFNGASNGCGADTVHATNGAGPDSTDATYTVTADTTAPSGGGLTVNGTAATNGGTSSYFTSGASVTLSTTPYSDGGSGLASQVVTVEQATLANDKLRRLRRPATVPARPDVTNGECYLFTITATDNVGNVTTLQTTVKVDTTPPARRRSRSAALGGQHLVSGTTLFYRPSAAGRSR